MFTKGLKFMKGLSTEQNVHKFMAIVHDLATLSPRDTYSRSGRVWERAYAQLKFNVHVQERGSLGKRLSPSASFQGLQSQANVS